MGKYERVSAGTVSILHRIIFIKKGKIKYERVSAGTVSIFHRQISYRGLAPDLTPGRLKEWWSV